MSIRSKIHNLLLTVLNEPKERVNICVSNVNYGLCMNGNTVLIVGGSRGIGFSIAQKMISEGAFVIITGRKENSLIEAQKKLGDSAAYVIYDNEKIKDRETFLDKCYSIQGKIDCFVLNAGISLHEGNFLNVSEEGFEKQFRINLESTYFLLQSITKRALSENLKSNILIVSSETSAKSNDLPYGLTKNAINSMIGGISRRVCQRGIRINGIAPGVTLTEMTSKRTVSDDLQNNSAYGRFLLVDEISNVAVFLLSEASSCINGEVVFCDGGNHLKINGLDSKYSF